MARAQAATMIRVIICSLVLFSAQGAQNVETTLGNIVQTGASVVQHLLSVHTNTKKKPENGYDEEVSIAPFGGVATGRKMDCGMTYIAANFNKSITINNQTMTPQAGTSQALLVKLSPFKEVEWVITGGGEGYDVFTSVTYSEGEGDEEDAGAVYVTGYTSSANLSFGFPDNLNFQFKLPQPEKPPPPKETKEEKQHGVHKPKEVYNGFVLKISREGVIRWVVQAVGPVSQVLNSASLDAGGNLFLVGTSGGETKFHHAATAEKIMIGEANAFLKVVTLGNTGVSLDYSVGFMLKVSRLGQVLWAHKMGPQTSTATGDDALEQVLVHRESGKVYAAGMMGGPAAWTTGGGTLFGDGGNAVVFQTDLEGLPKWMVSFGKESTVNMRGLALDPATAAVYVGGEFPASLSPLMITGDQNRPYFVTSAHNGSKTRDIFLLKLSALGTPEWVLSGGGEGEDRLGGVSGTESGHVLIGGLFEGHAKTGAQWGGQTFHLPDRSVKPMKGVTLKAPSEVSPFVSKITSTGTVEWATSSGMDGPIAVNAVTSDGCGNAIIGGYYFSASTFGTTSPLITDKQSIFAAKVGNIFTQCLCNAHQLHFIDTNVERNVAMMRVMVAIGALAFLVGIFTWWRNTRSQGEFLANQYIKNNYWKLHQDNKSRAMMRPKLDNIFSVANAAPASAYARVTNAASSVMPSMPSYLSGVNPAPPVPPPTNYLGHQPGSLTTDHVPFYANRSGGPTVAEARQHIASFRTLNTSSLDPMMVNRTRNYM